MTLKHQSLASLLMLSALFSLATSAGATTIEPTPFARQNIMAFRITSDFVEQDLLVEIALPLSYAYNGESHTYPVMYHTDGLLHFPLLASNNILLSFGDPALSPPMIPEIITVGIDFDVSFDQWDRMRLAYYTPTEALDEDYGLIGGQADGFLDFVRHELKPFIDSSFRVDTDQELLAGHSLGGLLSLYTLFTQSDLFEKYIAVSPSNYWDDEVIFDFEEAYHASSPSEPEQLFMGIGSREDPWGITLDYFRRLARQINRHDYQNLTLRKKVFRGHNHTSVIAHAYEKGARVSF